MSEDFELRLAAWIDGAMSPREAAAFEAALAGNPALAARAERWRANDRALAQAFAPLAEAPIDPALLARMGLAEVTEASAASAPQRRTAANDNPPWWRRRGPLTGAIAASVAALAVLLVPHHTTRQDALSLALDKTPSLARATLADGRIVVPTLTVHAADGRWCREFRSGETVSLACRGADRWTIEAQGRSSGAAQAPADGDYTLAGGGQDDPAIDAAYRRLGASDPVDNAAEAAAIAGHWAAHP